MKRRSLALAMVLLAAACSDGGDDAAPDGTAAFCDRWSSALASGDDDAIADALALAPEELADDAAVLRAADPDDESAEVTEAVERVLDFAARRCDGDTAAQVVAPPADADLGDLTLCSTLARPSAGDAGAARGVLYGSGTGDPYAGDMLGVLWNPAGDENHRGDGRSVPVTVRGTDGVAAEITVFQQTILPELGTVIAWAEDGVEVGLYGRGWSMDRAEELVAIADAIERDGEAFRVPDHALPGDLVEVHDGALFTLPVFRGGPFGLQYRDAEGDGLLRIDGVVVTPDQLETIRFFAPDVVHQRFAGRDALVGTAWHPVGGPAVVAWSESNDLAVVHVGLNIDLDAVKVVAEQSRPLSDDEWEAVLAIEPGSACQDE